MSLPTPMTNEDRIERFKWACLDAAVEHERIARRLRELVAKVADPPPNTHVEPTSDPNTIRFVTAVRGEHK